MAIKLAMSSKTAPQQGQAGISKKAKSIPNINAEGSVLTLLTALSQWAFIPPEPKEINPAKNKPPKIIKIPKKRYKYWLIATSFVAICAIAPKSIPIKVYEMISPQEKAIERKNPRFLD